MRMPDLENKKYNFQIKFDGSESAVNTTTYVQSLVSLTTVLREVNYQLGTGKKVEINVVAEQSGSFEVILQLIDTSTIEQLFNRENLNTLGVLVSTTVGIIQLRRWRKKADESKTEIDGDNVQIKDTEGNVLYQTNRNTYNIYTTNQAVNDAVTDQFKQLEEDENISGFEIKADDETARVEKDEFHEVAERFVVEVPEEEISEIPAKLVIIKVVFDNRERKWDFLYNGVKVSGTITDDNFWNEIDQGKAFSKGDELIADLKIKREYDSTVDAYVNTDYEVVNVRQHHPRQLRRQTSIEDEQEDE